MMRLAHSFIAILSEPTIDGIAFRVDLRLRPDPVSMPLVVSTKSALAYYDKRGQTWERAAMIKARPIAGDGAAAGKFLAGLESFVWCERLDFATVQALHEIKKRIDDQHRGGRIGEPGQDLKLGRGGIREIEFFAQAHQLVWGGSDPRFRTIATCESLRTLAKAGRIPAKVTETLIHAYEYLRRVEHRIQMVADKQTHSLPKDPDEFETLAHFLGYGNRQEFSKDLERHLRQVERQYEEFFELPSEMTEASASSALSGRPQNEATERLERLGFADPAAAFAIIEKWRLGRCPAARNSEALELLQALTPAIAIAACGTADPDRALLLFDSFIDTLSDGVHAFSLLQANLHVLETVAYIMVSAPAVGATLTARPALLEDLLDPATDAGASGKAALRTELSSRLEEARDSETRLDSIRTWVDSARFQVGVKVLFHSLSPLDAAGLLRNISECAVAAVLESAQARLAEDHGLIDEAQTAVLIGGRFQDGQAIVAAHLDLALCYDVPVGAVSDGSDPLGAPQYFERLQTLLLSCLRGKTGQRPIFSCAESSPPFRLDRSGEHVNPASAAPVAVLGTGQMVSRVKEAMTRAPSNRLSSSALRAELDEITRTRRAEAPPEGPWSVECRPGGLLDLEVLLQHLRAREAPQHPELLERRDGDGTLQVLERVGALSSADADDLRNAWRLWVGLLTVQHVVGGGIWSGTVPARLQPLVRDAANASSFNDVEALMDAAAATVRRISQRILQS